MESGTPPSNYLIISLLVCGGFGLCKTLKFLCFQSNVRAVKSTSDIDRILRLIQ